MQPAPIAVFLYNRIEASRRILESVSRVQAPRIYLFADGPKNDPDDIRRCREVRTLVEGAKLQCDVQAHFSTVNMGNPARILSGIETVFVAEQAAIFIEDDCMLAHEFFAYASDLLERYWDEPRVMMISGTNPLGRWRRDGADYLFSKLGNSHAWASWRRAWVGGARENLSWAQQATRDRVREFLGDVEQFEERSRRYGLIDSQPGSTWDYEWALWRQANHGLTIVPSINLARHGGNDRLALHVKRRVALDWISGLGAIALPLRHPAAIEPDHSFDRIVFEATNNRLAQSSVEFLAQRLIEDGQSLRAAAILKMGGKHTAAEILRKFPSLNGLVEGGRRQDKLNPLPTSNVFGGACLR